VLTGGIEFEDPYDIFGARFVVGAKRVCIALAVIALGFTGHDLLSSRHLGNSVAFAQDLQEADAAPLPARVEAKEETIAASATVAIPQTAKASAPAAKSAPSKVLTKAEESPVAELASARHLDAVEVAMAFEPSMAEATVSDLAAPATAQQALPVTVPVAVNAPMPRPKPVKLASIASVKLPAASPANISDIKVVPATEQAAVQPVAQPAVQPVAPAAEPSADSQAPLTQLASIDPEALTYEPHPETPAAEIHISLPLTLSVLPTPAPGAPPPSPALRLHLKGEARAKAERCLANAVYFEARDQPYQGQVAVAQVVMNRVFSGVYPRDVCGVIYQNAERHLACQFTFACDGKRDVVTEWPEWQRAKRIAQETLDGVLYVQAVGTATHYHANYVRPNWIGEMHRLAREGVHLFYRPIAWGSGADEPIWSRAQKVLLKKR
jgi:hypothetical protein